MEKSRKYEVDGTEIYVPLYRDDITGRWLEDYREWFNLDRFTISGHLILVSSERSCEDAESADEKECSECAQCRFYRRAAPDTWIGVCMNEKGLFLARDAEEWTVDSD